VAWWWFISTRYRPSPAGGPVVPAPERLKHMASREELTSMDQPSFEQLIREDRAARESKRWRGTFLEYLELARQSPSLPKLSHARLYDMMMRDGTQDILESDDPRVKRLYKDESLKVYAFFRDEFFGIEKTISQIVRYFHSASLKGEESRQVLYLMGPVGSGKSSLVEKLQRGLEHSDAFYAIDGCPMFEEPLHLLPRHLRKEFEKMLGVNIEGDLCPVCRFRLKEEFGTRYEEFPVVTKEFSKRNRVGVGVVPPVDPNNQDTSVLIGSEDISKLDLYSEGDPRVLDLNGALNVGNRGMVEFIEVFKNETEYLHAMITATQEKVIPAPGRHGMVYVDTCIVAHSNEAEWQKFKADHTNEAILDRIVVVKVPYNLRLSEEVKIYQKIIRHSDFRAHVAPHTLEVASMFAILSRLEPTPKCDLMTKLKLYNGEEVVEKGKTKKLDAQELRDDTKREGMNGISTRFIMKALDNALSDNVEGNCINPINVREALINMVKETDLPDDNRKQYLEFLQDVLHKEYLDILEKEITKAFVYSYQEQAESLFQNYLDHAEAFVNKTKVKDRNTKEELQPDEGFLKSIEEQIAIIGSAAEGFRQEVIAYLWASSRRGERVSYRSYEPLKEAIEKKLMTSVRDISRIITKARTRDEEQSEKYDAMVRNLLDNGYCKSCVDVVLKYAANNLWKD
jgi:serine protein kinase